MNINITTTRPILFLPGSITVRPYCLSDAEKIAHHANNTKIYRNLERLPHPYTLERSQEWIAYCTDPKNFLPQSHPSSPPDMSSERASLGDYVPKDYVVCFEDQPIGSCGLELDSKNPHTVSLGYWLGESFWGQGIGTLVATAFTEWTFKNFPWIMRIQADAYSWNGASQKVLRKAGFAYEELERGSILNEAKFLLGDALGNMADSISSLKSAGAPGTPSDKEVRIFDEPEHIEHPGYAYDERSPSSVAQSSKIHRATMSGRKLTGRSERPPLKSAPSGPSTPGLTNQMSTLALDSPSLAAKTAPEDNDDQALLDQVMQWLQNEKSRRSQVSNGDHDADLKTSRNGDTQPDADQSLDQLEAILTKFGDGSAKSKLRRMTGSLANRRGSLGKVLLKTQRSYGPSDTDGGDAIAEVPHIESLLDNTKTLSFAGGAADTSAEDDDKTKEQKHWEVFKQDILRLTHTLGLRGWRRLPIEYAKTMHVERLSGALTNAVYVVKPPKDYTLMQRRDEQGNLVPVKRLPKHLLLRIYGPSTDHLIDRQNELLILRRLAAKNIGPKLLGYFENGRFEEFLHAKTLTMEDIKDPAISKQIAKRMKELHEGIDLLESEREGGAFTFASWDKWVDRVEQVMTYLDKLVEDEAKGKRAPKARYTRRGHVVGTEWKKFREAYEKYRSRLIQESGGENGIRKRLVFAHNDTQYGNLMKLKPEEKSPLMEPTNSHKRLVVIDFEYANADPRGYEFANHFNEWCYNYHDAERPYACNTKWYPNKEEQYRFMRAYVMHRPQFTPSASSTPNLEAREKTNVPEFKLDARGPSGYFSGGYDEEERIREKAEEHEIQRLLHETRMWRMASSAFWVAWGIVQAPIPELDEPERKSVKEAVTDVADKLKSVWKAKSDPLDEEVLEKKEESKHDRPEGHDIEEAHREGDGTSENEEEEFDYLAYAQERAMFFWGDCIQMGIVTEGDLPEEMRSHINKHYYLSMPSINTTIMPQATFPTFSQSSAVTTSRRYIPDDNQRTIVMRPDEQRKIANYGILCGLRSDAASDSSRSSSARPSSQERKLMALNSHPTNGAVQRRPQSLTLPFDNRERESHLVSEEEFDRIIKQGELDNPLPSLPTAIESSAPRIGLRRSISTARNTMMSTKPRPMSADFSRLMASQGFQDRPGRNSFAAPSRDPTLTALPRPPTKNDLALYPNEPPSAASSAKTLRQRALTTDTDTPARPTSSAVESADRQTRHKRHRSAFIVTESIKKRLKRGGSNDTETTILPGQADSSGLSKLAMASPTTSMRSRTPFQSHPAVRPILNNSMLADTAGRKSTDMDMDVDTDAEAEPETLSTVRTPPESLKRSVLKRTWSRAKYHAAKLSISSPAGNNLLGQKMQISQPIAINIDRPPTAQSHHTAASVASTIAPSNTSTGTSHYHASAEQSPTNPSYEYVTGPVPKKTVLTRLGAPPSRTELNTVVSRQQSRIQDLTLQNNVLVNQISLLREEVQGMKVSSNHNASASGNASAASSEKENHRPSLSDRTLGRTSRRRGEYTPEHKHADHSVNMDMDVEINTDTHARRSSNGTAASRIRKDPNGWRHIMGVPMGNESESAWDQDDKRKTWMTCDS
ncbi:hypothetical protein LTR64_008300 [Lithohypha guttulata]|uniref:uncharacterized protein n=1 Tax=Lithohypha guttulata TaxID=1690604 RepID=UPI002DDE639F|nr:hypothetical protein LTR51_008452 [Lithohypha guttulata]